MHDSPGRGSIWEFFIVQIPATGPRYVSSERPVTLTSYCRVYEGAVNICFWVFGLNRPKLKRGSHPRPSGYETNEVVLHVNHKADFNVNHDLHFGVMECVI